MIALRGFALLATAPMFLGITVTLLDAEDEPRDKLPDKTKAILDKATELEFFSLEGDEFQPKVKDGFHGWKVLGKTMLKEEKLRKQILDALYQGISHSKSKGAKCFEPRHGIRAQADGKMVDLVICFACSWVYVYEKDTDDPQSAVTTMPNPQATFDRILKDRGVRLAEPAKK